MDLILWRHAEAHEHPDPASGQPGDEADLARSLTSRGEKQARRMAAWLDRQLPEGVRIYASPSLRTEQTAQALGRRFRVREALAPDAGAQALLDLVGWPDASSPVLVVGHQPTLGQVVARLLDLPQGECALKKGAVWWLRQRERAGERQTLVLSVQSPDML